MAHKKQKNPPTPPPLKVENPAPPDDFGRDLAGYLIPAYVLLIVAGMVCFASPYSMVRGNEMSMCRAVMASVNAATLTGFQAVPLPGDYRNFGQIVFVVLCLGGSVLSLIIGGLAVKRIVRLPYSDRTLIAAALLAVPAAGVIGMIFLPPSGLTLAQGFSQGLSALGNCGAFLGRSFAAQDWQTHLILLPLIVLGGLGLSVLVELWGCLVWGQTLSQHARTVLAWTAGGYLFFVALFVALCWRQINWHVPGQWLEDLRAILASCSVQAINSRTAGMPFPSACPFPRTMQWATMAAMVVGASSGGTGGGLKTTTLAEIWRGGSRMLRGQDPGRPLGIAMVWLGIYLALAATITLCLLVTENDMPADHVLFLALSAVSNVGLAHDQVRLSPAGLYILSAAMLAGRMTPLLILWWMADTTRDADRAIG